MFPLRNLKAEDWLPSALGIACVFCAHQLALGQTTWTERDSSVTTTLHGVTFGDGVFIAVGNAGVVLRSEDGVEWTRVPVSGGHNFQGVCHGRGLYLAVTQTGEILYSPDSFTWFGRRVAAGSLTTVTLAHSRFVAGGAQGRIYLSDDGVSWIEQTTPGNQELRSLTSYGGVMVAAGFLAAMWTSPDGEEWTPQNISAFPAFTSVLHFNGEFIATVGSGASMHRSGNGFSWNSGVNGTGARLNALAKGLRSIVAVGFDQTVFSSTNGVNWAERHRGDTSQLRSVAYGNGRFVAVGDGGAIFTSPETAVPEVIVSLEVVDAIASETGTNAAHVRLSRAGGSSQPLSVTLALGGTATSGVDYETLGPIIEIPAGVSETNLIVQAIADTEAEPREIVTISVVSAEGAAVDPLSETVAVFITDLAEPSDGPKLSAVAGVPGRGAVLQLTSVAGLAANLEAAEDLWGFEAWQFAFPVTNPFGQVLFVDPAATNYPSRYYRTAP
ncbi:MAG: hypothetical protein KIS67_06305 [Verrucomicrobiae bacterium]|nr:hypothetical protein [Verrucomicrobiae bacterium]